MLKILWKANVKVFVLQCASVLLYSLYMLEPKAVGLSELFRFVALIAAVLAVEAILFSHEDETVLTGANAAAAAYSLHFLIAVNPSIFLSSFIAIAAIMFGCTIWGTSIAKRDEKRLYDPGSNEPFLLVFATLLPLGVGIIIGGVVLLYRRWKLHRPCHSS